MAVMQKKLELAGSRGRKEVEALFDSGASYSCISKELAVRLEVTLLLPEPLEFETAEKGQKLQVTEVVRLDFHLNGYRFSDEFMVVPNLAEEVIIGTTTMQKWRFKLEFEAEEVIIDPRVTHLRLLELLKLG